MASTTDVFLATASWILAFQFRSTAQDPGPRGSPQVPQAPPPAIRGAELPELTAKVENWRDSSRPWHAGHSGAAEAVTSFSKRWSHSLQTYSKIGMASGF
jgi:hypothetical protein